MRRLLSLSWLAPFSLSLLLSSLLTLTPAWSQDPSPEPKPEEEVDPLDVELDRLETEAIEGKDVAGKLLEEIEENMRAVEKLLARKETGEESQSRQQKTIEQIEKLIEEWNKT